MTAAYCRVSTMHQAESGLGIAAQRDRIEAQAAADGLTVDQVFVDDGVSGSTIDRPAFTELLTEVRAGSVETVYTYSFSRISRSTRDMLDLVDVFRRHKVRLISLQERVDTNTSMGRFMMTIFAALSELERELARERTLAALAAKRNQGRRVGGVPYGFSADADGLLEPSEREQRVIARAQELARGGASTRDVASTLTFEGYTRRSGKPWSHDSVIRQLLGGEREQQATAAGGAAGAER